MTITRETADHAELARLAEAAKTVRRDANGRLDGDDAVRMWVAFHDAMSPAVCSALLSEIAALRGEVASLEIRRDFFKHNMTQAEHQRDEALGLLEEYVFQIETPELLASARAFLANQGADQ